MDSNQESQNNPLIEIDLERQTLGPQVCQQIAQDKWPNLQKLNLKSNNVGDQGCKYLAGAHLPALEILNLWDNSIKNLSYFCGTISQSSPFEKLLILCLCSNAIESVEPLNKLQTPQLQQLYLGDNRIMNFGPILKLKSSSLTKLGLQRNLFKEINGIQYLVNQVRHLIIAYEWHPFDSYYRREYKRDNQKEVSIGPLAKCQFQIDDIRVTIAPKLEQQLKKSFQRKCRRPIFY